MSEYRPLNAMLNMADEDISETQKSRVELARRYAAVRSSVCDDDAIDIIKYFSEGKSNAEIANLFGIDVSIPRAIVAYACDRDPEIYRRHLDPPKEKDPDPMTRTYILHRIPPLM